MHDNSYSIFFDNFNFTLNEIFSGPFSYTTEALHNQFDIYRSNNNTTPSDCNGSLLCSSSSLMDREGWSYAGSILACANAEVVSNTSGHPIVLVEIPQHEECVVKNTLLQTSFKGVYGPISFITMNRIASTSNILSFKCSIDRRTTLGETIKGDAQHQNVINDRYVRQFGFLPLVQYQFSFYSGSGHLQNPDMVDWISEAHQIVSKSKQFNNQSSRIPVPSGLNISNWHRYLVNYDLSIFCEYLQYGFPLNVDYENFQPITKVTNHASALKTLQMRFHTKPLWGPCLNPLLKLHTILPYSLERSRMEVPESLLTFLGLWVLALTNLSLMTC